MKMTGRSATRAISRAVCAFATALCATGCSTFLSAGQFGHDSLTPPPMSAAVADGGETSLVLGGSFARGALYASDVSYFGQAGAMRTWRSSSGALAFDGHAAASGWYGASKLNDEAGLAYSPSVDSPFAFYGGSAQLGMGVGLRFGPLAILSSGLRVGAAYEDGPYRDFRAVAHNASGSKDVVDACASGWSGSLGYEISLLVSPRRDFDLRFGAMAGYAASDLAAFFTASGTSLAIPVEQVSVSLRGDPLFASLAWNFNRLDNGPALSLGYVFKDRNVRELDFAPPGPETTNL